MHPGPCRTRTELQAGEAWEASKETGPPRAPTVVTMVDPLAVEWTAEAEQVAAAWVVAAMVVAATALAPRAAEEAWPAFPPAPQGGTKAAAQQAEGSPAASMAEANRAQEAVVVMMEAAAVATDWLEARPGMTGTR